MPKWKWKFAVGSIYLTKSKKDQLKFDIHSNETKFLFFFRFRYVLLIEADSHAVLTLHTKNEDGTYCRRSCSSRPTVIPPNILPHLYGQLVQTSQVPFFST